MSKELTKEEIASIELEAADNYPKTFVDNHVLLDDQLCEVKRKVHITAVTSERLRVRGLVEALEECKKHFAVNDKTVREQYLYSLVKRELENFKKPTNGK